MPSGYAALTIIMLPKIFPALWERRICRCWTWFSPWKMLCSLDWSDYCFNISMPVLSFWWNAPNTVHGNTRHPINLWLCISSAKWSPRSPFRSILLILGCLMDNPGICLDLPQRLLDFQTRSTVRVYFRPLPGEFTALFDLLFAMVRVSLVNFTFGCSGHRMIPF
jgi:hypothetical protein